MTTQASPADLRARIVESLTGATGDPKVVTEIARSLAERSVAAIVANLGETFGAPMTVESGEIEITRFGSSKPPVDSFSAMVIAAADNSPDALLLTIDADALAVAVCALFGADEQLPVIPITRPLSPIEIDVAAQLFDLVANAFNGSGERALGIKFPLGRPLTGEGIAKQVIRDGPAVRITIDLAIGDSRGKVTVTMPQRVLLESRGEGRASSRSGPQWRQHFSEEVMRSPISLSATIPLARMTLGELSRLKVGQLLEIPEAAPTQTKLSARGSTLFTCEFGRLGQNYTVRIVEPYDAQRELVEELLTA
jgi:flagellar motor switch protein FliM